MSRQFVFGRYRCDGCLLDRINEVRLPQMLRFATMSFSAIRRPNLEVYESVERRMLNVVRALNKEVDTSGTFASKF